MSYPVIYHISLHVYKLSCYYSFLLEIRNNNTDISAISNSSSSNKPTRNNLQSKFPMTKTSWTTRLLRWWGFVKSMNTPLRCSLIEVLLLWRCQCATASQTCLCWPAVAGGAQRLAENLQNSHHLHNIELHSQTPVLVNHPRASTVTWERRAGFNLYERERFIKLHASEHTEIMNSQLQLKEDQNKSQAFILSNRGNRQS